VEIGSAISEIPPRKARTNFPTQGNLKLKIMSEELQANERCRDGVDIFSGALNLLNLDKLEPLGIFFSTSSALFFFQWRGCFFRGVKVAKFGQA
jgi:hypothetical protein